MDKGRDLHLLVKAVSQLLSVAVSSSCALIYWEFVNSETQISAHYR